MLSHVHIHVITQKKNIVSPLMMLQTNLPHSSLLLQCRSWLWKRSILQTLTIPRKLFKMLQQEPFFAVVIRKTRRLCKQKTRLSISCTLENILETHNMTSSHLSSVVEHWTGMQKPWV